VPEAALPALHGDDSSSCLDNVQRKRVLQAEPNAVVNLDKISSQFQHDHGSDRGKPTSFCH
jgi:hypothetical protein